MGGQRPRELGDDVAELTGRERAGQAARDRQLRTRRLGGHKRAHGRPHEHDVGVFGLLQGFVAHNLLRWTSRIGLRDQTVRAARTLRRRLLQIPGRLTRTARQWTLHLPARWPWQHDFIRALARIRALPAAA